MLASAPCSDSRFLVLALLIPAFFVRCLRRSYVFFQTPSHNIGCLYQKLHPLALRCDIRSDLKPPPSKPKGCTSALSTGGYQVGATGRAQKVCAGDTVLSPDARVGRYGTTWRGGTFTCKSSLSGLRCKNRSGHGFFLSRRHSYRL